MTKYRVEVCASGVNDEPEALGIHEFTADDVTNAHERANQWFREKAIPNGKATHLRLFERDLQVYTRHIDNTDWKAV